MERNRNETRECPKRTPKMHLEVCSTEVQNRHWCAPTWLYRTESRSFYILHLYFSRAVTHGLAGRRCAGSSTSQLPEVRVQRIQCLFEGDEDWAVSSRFRVGKLFKQGKEDMVICPNLFRELSANGDVCGGSSTSTNLRSRFRRMILR